MSRFVLRRAGHAAGLLVLVSAIAFGLLHAVPGGPLDVYLSNPNVRPQDLERLRRSLGLDRPVAAQYVAWVGAVVGGDWGYSYSDGRPVSTRLAERLPATLELVGASLLFGSVGALVIGVWGAVRRGQLADRVGSFLAVAGVSLPVFWFGLILQLVFAVHLGWLPSSGRVTPGDGSVTDRLAHLALPATVLAFVHAAAWSRYLRSSMLDALSQPCIQAAASRGIPRARLVLGHALRHALVPITTVVCLDAAMMVSGAVVTESVFAWPGVGSLFTEALSRRDYTVLMAFLLLSAAAVIALNFAADVAARLLDPRIE